MRNRTRLWEWQCGDVPAYADALSRANALTYADAFTRAFTRVFARAYAHKCVRVFAVSSCEIVHAPVVCPVRSFMRSYERLSARVCAQCTHFCDTSACNAISSVPKRLSINGAQNAPIALKTRPTRSKRQSKAIARDSECVCFAKLSKFDRIVGVRSGVGGGGKIKVLAFCRTVCYDKRKILAFRRKNCRLFRA